MLFRSLVDPFSVSSIAEGLTRLEAEPELRRQLIEKGLENVHRFSWVRSAEQLWQNIVEVTAR